MKKYLLNNAAILATAGPSLSSKEQFLQAINAGALNFRFNLGKKERDYLDYYKNLNEALKDKSIKINVVLDLPSSRPRVGKLEERFFNKNEIAYIVEDEGETQCSDIPLRGLSDIIKYIKKNDKILFRDGKITFLVKDIDIRRNALEVLCLKGSYPLISSSSSSFPNSDIPYKHITKNDSKMLRIYLESNFIPEWIALSFAYSGEGIIEARRKIHEIYGENHIKIMSKIETPIGIKNLQEIMKYSDGIMVARGDLGLCVPPEKLPKIQSYIVTEALKAKKKCVVATQMLEIFAGIGTISSSELSDIALAVRQGASALMLSGESGGNKRSIDCIKLMNSIIVEETKHSINQGIL